MYLLPGGNSASTLSWRQHARVVRAHSRRLRRCPPVQRLVVHAYVSLHTGPGSPLATAQLPPTRHRQHGAGSAHAIDHTARS